MYLSSVRRGTVVLLDILVVAWVAAWIVVGVVIAREVNDLRRLGDTLAMGGQGLVRTGEALNRLSGLPFVGEDIGAAAEEVIRTGKNTLATSKVTADTVATLSPLLGWSIALIPSLPLLAVYLPWRIGRYREVHSIRKVLRTEERNDPAFQEYLARRATQSLPYFQLRRVSATPWDDLDDGRFEDLAAEELRRLGIKQRLGGG
jgi:hypothetical protein